MIPPQIPEKLAAFLGKITRNLAISKYRYNSSLKRGGGQMAYALEELAECIPADKGFPDWGLTLSVKNVTSTGLTLVVTQSDGEPTGTLQTGDPYRLICLVDGTWKNVEELPLPEGVDARTWNSIAYPLSKSETREFEINWEWILENCQVELIV